MNTYRPSLHHAAPATRVCCRTHHTDRHSQSEPPDTSGTLQWNLRAQHHTTCSSNTATTQQQSPRPSPRRHSHSPLCRQSFTGEFVNFRCSTFHQNQFLRGRKCHPEENNHKYKIKMTELIGEQNVTFIA